MTETLPETFPEKVARNPLRRLYDWTLRWAATPYALPALAVLSFVESSFFPVPPDVLLIAICFSTPARWFRLAFWCTAASVLGGLLGYAIGWGLTGNPGAVLSREQVVESVRLHAQYGFSACGGPDAHSLQDFTIASGLMRFDLTSLCWPRSCQYALFLVVID